MKVLLIYPYCLDDRINPDDVSVVPLGVYYVGALLKENFYDVEILNWYDINRTPQKIQEVLTQKRPDIIGISILHANRWGGIEIARIAKQLDPKVKIVFGGIGATFLWEHLLKYFNEIDFVVLGEGERTFLKLASLLDQGLDEEIKNIRGIAYRQGGEAVRTEDAEPVQDLDELPIPAKYFAYQHVSSTRGCPGNCSFCGSPRFWGSRVRFHSPDYFVGQLELLCKKGINFFYFSDDTFTLKEGRVIEICKKIVERDLDIAWAAISRVNCVSEEMLFWMRRAGCIQVSYGVESGSEKIRRRLNKKIKQEQIRDAFAMTTKYGIMARAYFIYGCPGESWETIQETLELINEIKPLSTIFYILDIFPGTALYSDFKRRCRVTDDIWLNRVEDIMYFETDTSLSEDLVLAFGERLRREYYEKLPGFADSVVLIDRKDLYQKHCDFFSRLAMTFSHGDYAGVEDINGKDTVAERLFLRSLAYYPDHRAYLGLGILKQKTGEHREAISILARGLGYFPDSFDLNMCQGISLMNLGEYEKALSYLLRFQDSKEVAFYIACCYRALGDHEREAFFRRRS